MKQVNRLALMILITSFGCASKVAVQDSPSCVLGFRYSWHINNDSVFGFYNGFYEFESYPQYEGGLLLDSYLVKVYDRWGELHFESSDTMERWWHKDTCPDSIPAGNYFTIFIVKFESEMQMDTFYQTVELYKN